MHRTGPFTTFGWGRSFEEAVNIGRVDELMGSRSLLATFASEVKVVNKLS